MQNEEWYMSGLSIYLDNCCFNRPYDDQNLLSIYLETQAKLSIQDLIRTGKLHLVWSAILDYENSRNPDEVIRDEIGSWRKVSSLVVHQDQSIIDCALEFTVYGISKKDALHIASAIGVKADYFITTDMGIIKKRRHIAGIRIVDPVDFIRILEEENENR
jgi:predicted nucleic acid-binding protein